MPEGSTVPKEAGAAARPERTAVADAAFAYSAVIPTRDRPQSVDRALRLLCRQLERPVAIVVVDASEPPLELDPATAQLVERAGIALRVVGSTPSTARQRNLGADLVETPLVLFLDDDVVIDDDYVAGLIRCWRRLGPDAIGGITGLPRSAASSWLDRRILRPLRILFMLHVVDRDRERTVIRRSGKVRYGVAPSGEVVVPAIASGAALYRTEIVRRHRFDDRFEGYVLGEDLDFSVRVSQEAPLVQTGERFEHRHESGGKHSSRRWYYRGRFEAYFRLRNHHLTGLRYPAFWLSVLAEACLAAAASLRELDRHHLVDYLRGVRASFADVRREQFSFHSRPYYRARSYYERLRMARLNGAAAGPLSPGIRILGYHRLGRGDPLCVAPDTFRAHLELALARGAEPISLNRAIELLATHAPVERPFLVVTFDDGYLDNLEVGVPILEDLEVPASIFLVSAVADRRDGYHWYRKGQPAAIRWEDARAFAGHRLVDFQAHGTYHRRLTALGEAEARAEIAGSKAEIEQALGTPVTAYCYASGVAGPREHRLVREAGYRAALTSTPGIEAGGGDPFQLPRLMVSWSDDDRRFALRLSGALGESGLERWFRERRRLEPLGARGEAARAEGGLRGG